ncbi:MAG: hypothetical protein WAW06_11165 [bacterium]
MKTSHVVTLLVSLLLPTAALSAPRYAGVVRVHFDESATPDLSVIRDTYRGPGPLIYAHIVIDSLPAAVNGYHLAYEMTSEDSSVVVIGCFHPSPGWALLDPSTDFARGGTERAATTPVSAGFWPLLLKNEERSRGCVRLSPVAVGGQYNLVLNGTAADQSQATRSYQGGINMDAPAPIELGAAPKVTPGDWTGSPDLEPVWQLRVEGERCAVLQNAFDGGITSSTGRKGFPVDFVQVTARRMAASSRLGSVPTHPTAYIKVLRDGTLEEDEIEWGPRAPLPAAGKPVASSLTGQPALFSNHSETTVVGQDAVVLSDIPERVKWGMCFDFPQRIAAIATQDVGAGDALRRMSRLLLLDFDGRPVFEGDWIDCQVATVGMGLNPDIVKYSLEGCSERGEYLLRVSERKTYSLNGLSQKGKSFSPDSRSVLVNRGGEFSFFDSQDPEALRFLWKCGIDGLITDVAVSDDRRFVAYRLQAKPDQGSFVYVLSGADGRPVCRLRENPAHPAPGPLGFVGNYLFVGMGFSVKGTAWETESVYLFDLGMLRQ